METRLKIFDVTASQVAQPICDAVYQGLTGTPRNIPCRFFYDRVGSEIFEEITRLPEYYLTRCEDEILEKFSDRILAAAGEDVTIVEFGSGSSSKTRHLISAALRKQESLQYIPIDISRDFLLHSANELLSEYPELEVTAVAAEYLDAIGNLPEPDGPRLFVFLGSNIGNFCHEEATEFLSRLSGIMRPEDRLLLGTDLVKDREVLHQAYNDDAGVTARFNLNLLHRVNRELRANFEVSHFEHQAAFDEANSRIEMRLISKRRQTIYIEDLDSHFEFHEDEVIRTEWSHKYTHETAESLAAQAGLQILNRWSDSKNYFSEFLIGKCYLK